MSKTRSKVSEFRQAADAGVVEVRPIGGRVLLPGEYKFDADPELRYESRKIRGTADNYLQVEIKSSKGWIDLSLLMKRTKVGESLEYINDWIQQYADLAELAGVLAGNTLVITGTKVDTFSTYKDGQQVDPYVNGSCYKAVLQQSASQQTAEEQSAE